MPLPTEKSQPKRGLSDISILLYGPSKIGKSTFASQFPDALFLATEPGLNALEVYQQPIASWAEFLAACADIKRDGSRFRTVVIDTLDALYRLASEHVCAQQGVDHAADGKMGKVYGMITNEIYRVLLKLGHLPQGLVLISHSMDKEFETRTGNITKTVPTLSRGFADVVAGYVDMILLADTEFEEDGEGKRRAVRVIRSRPNPSYIAGGRYVLPEPVIPLDYDVFVKAFQAATIATAQTHKNIKAAVEAAQKQAEPTTEKKGATK